jgi:predicted RNA binding protein YcfA (HicA-like mRNA interferase family)
VSSKEVIRRLIDAGWQEMPGKGKGSHVRLVGPENKKTTVPHPKKDLPLGTLKAIEKQTGVKLT